MRALAWGLLHFASVSARSFRVGLAVQAVVDRSGARLALTGVLLVLAGAGNELGDTFLHRSAVTNWITVAAHVQQLLARTAAHLGSALTRRVAVGEIVTVSTGDAEKIGWFVERAPATCSPASPPTSTGSPTLCARPCRSGARDGSALSGRSSRRARRSRPG